MGVEAVEEGEEDGDGHACEEDLGHIMDLVTMKWIGRKVVRESTILL